MPNMNSKLRKALKPLKNPKTGWKNKFIAVIGKGDGTILTDVPGEVWVRDALSGQEFRAHNSVVPNIGSITNPLQVIVGTSIENPDILEIISTRKTFSAPAGSGLVNYHFDQHVLGGPDSGLFPRKQIGQLTVLVADAANFIVQVYGGQVRTATGMALIANEQIDLSAYVPTTGAVYVNIESDDDGVLTMNDGTPFAAKELATAEDIPVPGAGQYRIATIILFETMEALLDEHILVPIPLEMPAGGSGGVWGTFTGDINDQTDLIAEIDAAEADAITAAEAYADSLVVGLWDDRGSFDASGGAYPSSGGSGTAGAILKGDVWTISVAGTLPTGQVVEVGDIVRALVNTPGNTQANWAIQQNNIGYVAENSANKTSTITGNEASTTLYATIKGIVDWAKQGLTGVLSSKTTPVDADSVLINDSADSNKTKLTTWANIKATLKTYFDTLYAAVANGVTNGDSHDHNGGDGAQIAHGNLSSIGTNTHAQIDTHLALGSLVPYSNAVDIFRVANSPGGASAWAGTFTAAGSSGSTIKYATTSGTAAAMTPNSTSNLGKMRLYNTTRGNSVLISNHVAGTITSTAAYPGNWANGDVLTIASQTVSGGGLNWFDLEITDAALTGKLAVTADLIVNSATAGDLTQVHPFETFGTAKVSQSIEYVVSVTAAKFCFVKLTGNVFSMTWTGTPLVVALRVSGYITT